jgi:hypothetical protein
MELHKLIILASTLVTAGGGVGFTLYYYTSKLKQIGSKITDRDIVELAKQNNGKITPALVCEHFDVSLSDAKIKLDSLTMSGVISTHYDWNDWSGTTYMIKGYEKGNNPSINLPKTHSKIALTDAEVIRLAVAMGGSLTPSALCFKADISVDAAKAKLEELYKKEIFELQVADNGTYLYVLVDKKLLG